LSRERVARAGLELADREGVDALSMRRLAQKLGTGTMTLYWHFKDKNDLLDAINDAAVTEQELPALRGPWRERIHQLVGYTRGLFARHPSIVEIWARQPVLGGAALRGVEAGLEILQTAGFDREESVLAFRLLVIYTYGFALFSGPRADRTALDGTRAALAALPQDRYPRLREAAGAFAAAMASEEAFTYGLERILDGLEASLGGRR
jgi:AcrR family transcriptional regulator